jgi:hypothetical protein
MSWGVNRRCDTRDGVAFQARSPSRPLASSDRIAASIVSQPLALAAMWTPEKFNRH